jgi:hypothetical protein
MSITVLQFWHHFHHPLHLLITELVASATCIVLINCGLSAVHTKKSLISQSRAMAIARSIHY